ncbi:MAG: class I SAM-dependent methyltransferase [Planctomycetaceae bacterium]|nr:class I SAM-dependent methyltransferase [Planctomycetaceae bacterium]
MHKSSFLRMEWFVNQYLGKTEQYKVLDVGSYDVNGTYKGLFQSDRFSYTGLDMESGPNVDIVPRNPYKWSEIADSFYDVVISGQAIEHCEFFWVTVGEMARVLRPGGLLCLIAPRGFALHRYPVDCYRFDVDGVIAIARFCNLEPIHASTNLAPSQQLLDWYSTDEQDTLLVAKKPDNWSGLVDLENYKFEKPDINLLATGMLPMNG